MTTIASLMDMESGVLEVLAGRSRQETADRLGMAAGDLANAVECYRTAGRAALEARADSSAWHQVHIEFVDWKAIEQDPAAHLRTELDRAKAAGVVSAWWFIRKAPCWRLRFQPGTSATGKAMEDQIARLLNDMKSRGHIANYWTSIYEPETAAFGGDRGMQIAHELFHADSRAVLGYLSRHAGSNGAEPAVGRRELSVALCSALMRGAGQDWFEQGDVWSRVADLRPISSDVFLERLPDLAPGLRHLMTIDTSPQSVLLTSGSQLTFASSWLESFAEAGAALAATTLSRGMRDVLAHHIIFHWNRLGLSARTQSILSRATKDVIFPTTTLERGPTRLRETRRSAIPPSG